MRANLRIPVEKTSLGDRVSTLRILAHAFLTVILLSAQTQICLAAETDAKSLQPVQLRGSTTLLPIAQQVGENYMREHPGASIVISGGGTARGYKALLDGTADIAMASSTVPEEIATEIARRNIKFVSVTVGYDALVTVVHPTNPVNNLRLDQVKNIFTGRIKNWKEVGGKNAPIQVLVGPPSGGVTETWKQIVLGSDDTYTPAGIVLSSKERVEKIIANPNAITFLTYGTIKTSLKLLSLDGVHVTAETILDGRYHLRVPLMLATTDKPSASATNFIEYFSTPQKNLPLNLRPNTGAAE